jgi:hypothetical protein
MTVTHLLTPHDKDLGGGFIVRRLLPAAQQQAVGPFLFFDHFGPVDVTPFAGQDVRPHPHIGLATVTYLFEGAINHHDSLGSKQRIEPGAINWMTAGRGIVHSERTPPDLKDVAHRSHGLQLWAALPAEFEETAPSFSHTPAADIPEIEFEGARVRVLVGSAFGLTSPVQTFSETLYLDITLDAGVTLTLDALPAEAALYAVDGELQVGDTLVPAQRMALIDTSDAVELSVNQTSRIMLIGGAPLGHRFIW